MVTTTTLTGPLHTAAVSYHVCQHCPPSSYVPISLLINYIWLFDRCPWLKSFCPFPKQTLVSGLKLADQMICRISWAFHWHFVQHAAHLINCFSEILWHFQWADWVKVRAASLHFNEHLQLLYRRLIHLHLYLFWFLKSLSRVLYIFLSCFFH